MDFENKTLEQLLDPLNKNAQQFLILRLLGMGIAEALRCQQLNQNSATLWRTRNPYFKQIEAYVLAKKDEFSIEAKLLQDKRLVQKGTLALSKILNQGDQDWDKVKDSDKRYIIRGLAILGDWIKKGSIKVSRQEGETYDEMIMRLRREERKGGKKQ